MDFLRVLIMFLAGVCLGRVQAHGGARAAISQKLIDYAVTTFVPILESKLSGLTFPSISGSKDSIDYSVSGIHVTGLSVGSPSVSFVKGTGIALQLNSIHVSAHMDWSYKEKIWPHEPRGSGSADASAGSNTYVHGTVAVTIVDGKPHVNAENLAVSIDDFSIDVHGSLLSWLYNLIVKSFKGSIKSAIGKAISDAVTSEVNGDLNKILGTLTMTQALPLPKPYDVALVDYTILGVDIEADHLALDIRGSVNDTDKSAPPYAGVVPALPPASSAVYASHHMTVDLTTFLLDSAAYVFARRGVLKYTVTGKDLPSSAPIKLDTSTFVDLVPGLKKWPNTDMSITLGTSGNPTFGFSGGIVSATLPAAFNFSVLPSNATAVDAFGLTCACKISANASIDDQNLKFSINPGSTCTPANAYSHVGPVDSSGFALIVNLAIAVGIPAANKALQKGIPLPSIEGVAFANSKLAANSDILTLMTDITYKPNM